MCFLMPQHSRYRGWLAHGESINPVQSPSPCRHPGHASYFHPFNSCRKTLSLPALSGEAAAASSVEGWKVSWPGCPSSDTGHPCA